MTIFDLLFLALLPALAVWLARAFYWTARDEWGRARRLWLELGAAAAVYLSVVVATSVATPRRRLRMGEDQCFDDWCLAAERVTRVGGEFYAVTLRVSSRAKRVRQREWDAGVRVVDGRGRRYEVSAAGQRAFEAANGRARPLSDELGPGDSFETVRVFDAPGEPEGLALEVTHGAGPGLFIIGGEGSLFHRETVTDLVVSKAR